MELTRQQQSFAFLKAYCNDLSLVRVGSYSNLQTVYIKQIKNAGSQRLDINNKIVLRTEIQPNAIIIKSL